MVTVGKDMGVLRLVCSKTGRVSLGLVVMVLSTLAGTAQASVSVDPKGLNSACTGTVTVSLTADADYCAGEPLVVEVTVDSTVDCALVALNVDVALPPDWHFMAADPLTAPKVVPSPGASGVLSFAYLSIPSFPNTFTFTVRPAGVGPQSITAATEYRTGGPIVPGGEDTVALEDRCGGEGGGMTEGEVEPCAGTVSAVLSTETEYCAGEEIVVQVALDSTATCPLTALNLDTALPAGWRFVAASGTDVPDILPVAGAQGNVAFAYFSSPAFPASFDITLRAAGSAAQTLNSQLEFRDGGAMLEGGVAPLEIADGCGGGEGELEGEAPVCEGTVSLALSSAGTYCDVQEVVVEVALSGTTTCPLNALSVDVALPEGWAFAAAAGADVPGVLPAAGAEGTLSFAYLGVPVLPARFEITVLTAGSGAQSVVGQSEFRMGGGTQPGGNDTTSLAEDCSPGLRRNSVDADGDRAISLSELLRTIQFYNAGSYSCAASVTATEDGYQPGAGDRSRAANTADCNPQDWSIDLGELLRVIQFLNGGGYHACPGAGSEDGYCVGR